MPISDEQDSEMLAMSGVFLSLLASDKTFAQKFDSDPASALQDLFPNLKNVPKQRITSVLEADKVTTDRIANVMQNSPELSASAGLLSRLARTSLVTALVSGVASALVSKVLTTVEAEEPDPE